MHGPDSLFAGRYRLHERVGTGGMGEVWRATDETLGRTVAVKVMQPALLDDPAFGARFRAEARMMASIDHPGVVRVHDYYRDDEIALLVMDFVPGESLARLLARQGRLPADRAMEIVAAVHEYLSSVEWAESRVAAGGYVADHARVDPATAPDPVDQLLMEVLQAPATEVHFPPSSVMPPSVYNAVWDQLDAWIQGQDTRTTAGNIEDAWP